MVDCSKLCHLKDLLGQLHKLYTILGYCVAHQTSLRNSDLVSLCTPNCVQDKILYCPIRFGVCCMTSA